MHCSTILTISVKADVYGDILIVYTSRASFNIFASWPHISFSFFFLARTLCVITPTVPRQWLKLIGELLLLLLEVWVHLLISAHKFLQKKVSFPLLVTLICSDLKSLVWNLQQKLFKSLTRPCSLVNEINCPLGFYPVIVCKRCQAFSVILKVWLCFIPLGCLAFLYFGFDLPLYCSHFLLNSNSLEKAFFLSIISALSSVVSYGLLIGYTVLFF